MKKIEYFDYEEKYFIKFSIMWAFVWSPLGVFLGVIASMLFQ